MKANGELLAGLVAHLLLVGLPGIAAALYAMRRGVRELPVLLAIWLAASGATALLAFWAYYANSAVGTGWDFLLLLASLATIVWAWRGGLDRALLARFSVPVALWVLGTGFIVFLGFLHGGVDNAIPMSALRFSGQLPSDNDIPRFFAEWFSTHGHVNPPPEYPGEWLMSDRPPLQVGYVLAQRGFMPTEHALHYEILCVAVQALWIVGMWAVLLAARLRARTRALAMFAAMVSDIAILHGFFVWPKLIAAAFLLAALALVISPSWSRDRRDLRVGALIGVLLALAMLSHGSSVFGVIPLVVFAAWRGLPSWRWLGVAVLAAAVAYAPWVAYQHYADPPGNRLIKWQLGGDTQVDSKGTLEAIEDGYGEEGFDGTVQLKSENFGEMVGWPRFKNGVESGVDDLEAGKPGLALEVVREVRFFSLLPFLGFLLAGPLAMLLCWRRPREPAEWRFALLCFAFFALACAFWGLLLFGLPDSRATIHVGSLAVPLLGLVGCVVGLRAILPRLAAWLVGLNVLFVLALYVPSLTPEAGTSYSLLSALLALVSLAGVAWVLWREERWLTELALPSAASVRAFLGPERRERARAGGPGKPGEPRRSLIPRLRRSLDSDLFPSPLAAAARFTRTQTGALIAALLVLGTVLGLLRLGTDAFETVWAEDGPVYLQSALTQGFWHAIVQPYAGYLVVGPHLIAEVAALFPLRDTAAAISIVSAFVAALSGLAVWYGSAGHLRNPYLRGGLALATVLAATAGQETLDSAAYAPWFMLVGTFWLLFLRPRTWWGAGFAGAFVLLTGLSTPGVWFFLPVAALRAFSTKWDRRTAIVLGSWLAGGLVQIPVIMAHEQGSPMWSRHIWTALVQRVIDGGVFGQRLGGGLWDQAGWGFLILLCLVVVVFLAWGLVNSSAGVRWFVAVAIPISFVMFILSVYQRTVGPNIFWSPGISGGTASRYVLVPAMIFLSALVVTLDGVLRGRLEPLLRRRSSWVVGAAVALMVLAVAVSFDMRNPAREQPYWEDAIEAAANKCVANGEELAAITTVPPPFGVQLPCTEVESFATPALRNGSR
ncbi:MAG TPA: hypothetical protein VGG40_10345 [Solirubrobacterales bacterium]